MSRCSTPDAATGLTVADLKGELEQVRNREGLFLMKSIDVVELTGGLLTAPAGKIGPRPQCRQKAARGAPALETLLRTGRGMEGPGGSSKSPLRSRLDARVREESYARCMRKALRVSISFHWGRRGAGPSSFTRGGVRDARLLIFAQRVVSPQKIGWRSWVLA